MKQAELNLYLIKHPLLREFRYTLTLGTHTDTLLVASKEIGLEVNADNTKYMVMSRDQNARRKSQYKE